MQNPLIIAGMPRYPKYSENGGHAASNAKQRLLWPIERRFLHQTFITERSRCGSIVCQDSAKSNSASSNIA
jgi:hypothetical protein